MSSSLLTTSLAQVNTVYNQFFINPFVYNPAYAGVEGHSVVFALYRQQWANFNNSPSIGHVTFHTPLKGGIGLGAFLFNESQGPLNTSWGKVSSSYLMTIDKEHYLRFGLSVGGGTNSLSLDELDDPTDPAFQNLVSNSTFLLADFGATYHFGHFNAGFSLPNLIGYDVVTGESMSPISVSPLDNVLFKINYRGHINDDLAIEPHFIYRFSDVNPDQFEATAIIHIKHISWVGATFRQDNNLIALAGIKLKEKFAIGYSFELGNSNISSDLGPTHEIHIGYHISSKKEHAQHVSSFIKSHRLSAEQRARKAELERERKLEALRKSRQVATSSEDEDALTIVGNNNNIDEEKTEASQPSSSIESEKAVEEERVNEFGEKEKAVTFKRQGVDGSIEEVTAWVPADSPNEKWQLVNTDNQRQRTSSDGTQEIALEFIRTNAEGKEEKIIKWHALNEPTVAVDTTLTTIEQPPAPDAPISETELPEDTQESQIASSSLTPEETKKVDPSLSTDFRSYSELAASDKPLSVKRGDHLLELSAGNYVIAGAFEIFELAEEYSDRMFERGFHDTIVGYITARGYYYVVIFQSDDIEKTREEKNRVRKLSGLSNVWTLKVSE